MTPRRWVSGSRRFGTMCQLNLQGFKFQPRTPEPLYYIDVKSSKLANNIESEIVNWEGCGIKTSWPILQHCPGTDSFQKRKESALSLSLQEKSFGSARKETSLRMGHMSLFR